ncbi:uncharacterized protein LOC117782744 [Drosophila innubila]|uniref:uncharacterized protein LOC117782744 n=1 Tax=Drosophila innubila TaxID=198719 RepID=UPI00148D7C59|nr:uncharacterized protein LOC117782744 [Drosophila innubila]
MNANAIIKSISILLNFIIARNDANLLQEGAPAEVLTNVRQNSYNWISLREIARHFLKMILVGSTLYPRRLDFKQFLSRSLKVLFFPFKCSKFRPAKSTFVLLCSLFL